MRVIAGEFRRRTLKSLPGLDTRPTPDRLRETLFNILQPRIEGSLFVDAYAGTGSVGIEALSRGAARAIFIESSRDAAAIIKENLAILKIAGRAEVQVTKTLKAAGSIGGDIWFLDPPYELADEYPALLTLLGTRETELVVIAQHSKKQELAPEYGRLTQRRVVKQGDNLLTFFA